MSIWLVQYIGIAHIYDACGKTSNIKQIKAQPSQMGIFGHSMGGAVCSLSWFTQLPVFGRARLLTEVTV